MTSSPLTVYLSLASACNILGIKTGLYKRVASHRLITSVLGALVLLFWFALFAIIVVSHNAFTDSKDDGGDTFVDMLRYLFFTLLFRFLQPDINFLLPENFFPLFYIIFLASLVFIVAKTRLGVAREARSCGRGKSKPWVWFYVPWMFVKCLWCVFITVDPQSTKSETTKAYHQPQPQMVHIHYISIFRCQLGVLGHQRCGDFRITCQ